MLHGRICRQRRTPPGSGPCTSPRIAVGPKNARGPRGPAAQGHPSRQHAGARRQGGRLSLSWEKFLLRPLSSLIRLQGLSHWRLTQRVPRGISDCRERGGYQVSPTATSGTRARAVYGITERTESFPPVPQHPGLNIDKPRHASVNKTGSCILRVRCEEEETIHTPS